MQAPVQAQGEQHLPEAGNPWGQIPTPGSKEMELQMQAYHFTEHRNTNNNAPSEEMQNTLSTSRLQCTNTMLRLQHHATVPKQKLTKVVVYKGQSTAYN